MKERKEENLKFRTTLKSKIQLRKVRYSREEKLDLESQVYSHSLPFLKVNTIQDENQGFYSV